MKVVIAGGTGFIGKPLVKALVGRGDEVVILSRSKDSIPGTKTAVWTGKDDGPWESELEGADAIINLAGSSISQRWDEAGKRSILNSRLDSCRAIGQAISRRDNPPKLWVQGSAVGFYGDTGEREVDETSAPGTGFLAETCVAWEESAREYGAGITQSFVRTGIVFGKGGGALDPLVKLTKSFLGGSAGNGRQFMPWIQLEDQIGVLLHCLDTGFEGIVNAVQPVPARNSEVMGALRKVLGRPWSPPAPAFGIKLVEAIAGIPSELILGSQRVTTRVLPGRYTFRYADLESAIRASL